MFVALEAKVVPEHHRATSLGHFETIYGVAWIAGSVALGILYDRFIWGLVALSMAAQLPVFFAGVRKN